MSSSTHEAQRRFQTVQRLQENLSNLSPGTYWADVYEKALDLALNVKRAVLSNFYYRVVDDAKRSLRRIRKNTPSFTTLFESKTDDYSLVKNPLAIDYVTPEQKIIYQQTVSLLRSACSRKHRHSIAVFYSMLEGYSVNETAKKLNISESMVKKLRSEIVKLAKKILLN